MYWGFQRLSKDRLKDRHKAPCKCKCSGDCCLTMCSRYDWTSAGFTPYCGCLRNPAPVDRCFIHFFVGFQPSKVVKDFFHQQYLKKWKHRKHKTKRCVSLHSRPMLHHVARAVPYLKQQYHRGVSMIILPEHSVLGLLARSLKWSMHFSRGISYYPAHGLPKPLKPPSKSVTLEQLSKDPIVSAHAPRALVCCHDQCSTSACRFAVNKEKMAVSNEAVFGFCPKWQFDLHRFNIIQ